MTEAEETEFLRISTRFFVDRQGRSKKKKYLSRFPHMECTDPLRIQRASTWSVEDWNSAISYVWGPTGPVEKEKFGVPRADLQFRTTPGHFRLFFAKVQKEDEATCQCFEFEHGLGRLLMDRDKIVIMEFPLSQIGAHDGDVIDDASSLPQLQLYHRYDDLGDRLIISLLGSEVTYDQWNSATLALPDTLGYDLLLGHDGSGRVIGISIMFASQLLPKMTSSASPSE